MVLLFEIEFRTSTKETKDMAILIRHKADLLGSSRHVKTHAYETVRFLLKSDGVGLTLTDIVLKPDVEAVYGYEQHLEVAYCLSGHARLTEVSSKVVHDIRAGTLWAARAGEHFSFVAFEETRLICAFTPAFEGDETGFAKR